TIFTDKNPSAANGWMNFREDGRLVIEGLVVIRGLGDKGISADAGTIHGSIYTTNVLVLESQGATASNANGFIINAEGVGSGRFYHIPTSYGEVLSDFYVVASD